jgi:hypothetical protein
VLAELHRRDDVRMMDLRGDRRLFEEHLFHALGVGRVGPDDLDGEDLLKAARPPQASGPYLGHSPAGNGNEELVASQDVADRILHDKGNQRPHAKMP